MSASRLAAQVWISFNSTIVPSVEHLINAMANARLSTRVPCKGFLLILDDQGIRLDYEMNRPCDLLPRPLIHTI